MEIFSALLALCEGNPPVTRGFSSQRPVTRSFDVFFDLHLNKRLSKQSRRRWLETSSLPLWRHCNDAEIELNMILRVPGVWELFNTVYCVLLPLTYHQDVACRVSPEQMRYRTLGAKTGRRACPNCTGQYYELSVCSRNNHRRPRQGYCFLASSEPS